MCTEAEEDGGSSCLVYGFPPPAWWWAFTGVRVGVGLVVSQEMVFRPARGEMDGEGEKEG